MDRNPPVDTSSVNVSASLSARRAWIEIKQLTYRKDASQVALRKESVDRNIREDVSYSIIVKSLSARRAWIEIAFVVA